MALTGDLVFCILIELGTDASAFESLVSPMSGRSLAIWKRSDQPSAISRRNATAARSLQSRATDPPTHRPTDHLISCDATPINAPNKTVSTGAPCNGFYPRIFAEFVGVRTQ